jgi:hypothetical protein
MAEVNGEQDVLASFFPNDSTPEPTPETEPAPGYDASDDWSEAEAYEPAQESPQLSPEQLQVLQAIADGVAAAQPNELGYTPDDYRQAMSDAIEGDLAAEQRPLHPWEAAELGLAQSREYIDRQHEAMVEQQQQEAYEQGEQVAFSMLSEALDAHGLKEPGTAEAVFDEAMNQVQNGQWDDIPPDPDGTLNSRVRAAMFGVAEQAVPLREAQRQGVSMNDHTRAWMAGRYGSPQTYGMSGSGRRIRG